MKKAQIQSKLVIYTMVSVLAVLLLIFGLISINKFNKRQREIIIDQLEKDVKAMVGEIEYLSQENEKFKVPKGVDLICFFDLRASKRVDILKSPILEKFPLIKSSIESGELKNMFLIDLKGSGPEINEIIKRYVGDICFNDYPYFDCFEPKGSYLDLTLEGVERCALIVTETTKCKDISGFLDPDDALNDIFNVIFNVYTMDIDLTIPIGTIITLMNLETQVCLKQVPPPDHMDDDLIDSLISEVFKITPITAKLVPEEATLIADYYSGVLPPNTDEGHIKMMHYSSDETKWDRPEVFSGSGTQSADLEKHKITSLNSIGEFGLYAAFGPVPPVAVIEINGVDPIDCTKVGDDYYCNINKDIKFDASESRDADGPDDIDTYEWDFDDGSGTVAGIDTTRKYTGYGTYTVTLTVTDKEGFIGIATADISIINDNNEKKDELVKDSIFLVPKTTSPDINKKDIFQLLPLTTPNVRTEEPYPLIIYHGSISSDDINNLKGKFTKTKVYNFGVDTIEETTDVSLPVEYLDFWETDYEDIIVVKDSISDPKLLNASLFAALINAPLIYESDISTLTSLDPPLDPDPLGKKAHLFGNVGESGLTIVGRYYTATEGGPSLSRKLHSTILPPDVIGATP